jgi:hypothetical protein
MTAKVAAIARQPRVYARIEKPYVRIEKTITDWIV